MQLEKYLEVPTPNIMCGHMIRKRGRGHILGSCYAVVKILRSTYATNVMFGHMMDGGRELKNV